LDRCCFPQSGNVHTVCRSGTLIGQVLAALLDVMRGAQPIRPVGTLGQVSPRVSFPAVTRWAASALGVTPETAASDMAGVRNLTPAPAAEQDLDGHAARDADATARAD
jgi:hypothetical protein